MDGLQHLPLHGEVLQPERGPGREPRNHHRPERLFHGAGARLVFTVS